MNIPARTIVFTAILLCASFIITTAVSGLIGYYRVQSQKNQLKAATAAAILTSQYKAYLTIVSFDPASRSVVARVRSATTAADLTMLVQLAPGFEVMRQDAVIENGVVMGAPPPQPASLADLTAGTRGIGILKPMPNGHTSMLLLLIGDPFPRP